MSKCIMCGNSHKQVGGFCSNDCAMESLEEDLAKSAPDYGVSYCTSCRDFVPMDQVDDEGICASCIFERMELAGTVV